MRYSKWNSTVMTATLMICCVQPVAAQQQNELDGQIKPPPKLAEASSVRPPAATPLPRAHAHNDYLHDRPLFDALDRGFCSVEADIYLVDGELRVGHSRSELKAGSTLESLYLEPLKQIVSRNKIDGQPQDQDGGKAGRASNGRVYPGGPVFTLLIDIKTDGETVYQHLHQVLTGYRDILCRVENGHYVETRDSDCDFRRPPNRNDQKPADPLCRNRRPFGRSRL